MSQPDRGRPERRLSPLSVGLQWASTVTTVGLEMALPPLLGAWVIDPYFGTEPIWTIVLAVLGFVVAMRHLWDISKRLGRRGGRPPGPPASPGRKGAP